MVLTPMLGTDGARHQMSGEEIVLAGNYFVWGGFFIAYYNSFSVAPLHLHLPLITAIEFNLSNGALQY